MANNTIQLKRSSVAGKQPNTSTLAVGELALNLTDQKIYSSNGTGIFEPAANVSDQRVTNSLTIDNNKNIYFKTVNTSAAVGFRQQTDDNFVMYSTTTAYGQRPVWSIYANSNTSAFSLSVPSIFNANINLGGVSVTSNGSTGTAGQYLTSNGTATYWSSPGVASVNTSAQWTWNNTHTFNANVTFSGNGIGITSNTGAIYLGGIADANWKIARNSGVVTKWRYTNNTVDIVTANSNLEGMAIGLVNGNSYFETGYLGTYISSNVTIGNSSVNVSINSTSFSGTANNSSYLGGTIASGYQTTSGLSANVATLSANAATYLNGKTEGNLNVNNALTSNNASYLGGTIASGYQTTAGLSANVATLAANSATYLGSSINSGNSTGIFTTGTVNAASHTTGAPLTGTGGISANVTTFVVGNNTINTTITSAGLTVNGTAVVANSSGVYTTGTVNAASHTTGATGTGTGGVVANTTIIFIGNNTINAAVNTTTLYIGGNVIANSTGANNAFNLGGTAAASYALLASPTFTGTVSVANLSVSANLTITAVGDLVITAGAGIYANGGLGTAGQVLTSNATSVYWSTVSGGGGASANSTGGNGAIQYYNGSTLGSSANLIFDGLTVATSMGFGNKQNMAYNYSTNASLNMVIVGPFTVNTGYTFTITAGSRVVII